MQHHDPDAAGKLLAETLVTRLEAMKAHHAGPQATPEAQLEAGEAAVAAMKRVLGGVMAELRPPGEPKATGTPPATPTAP